MSSTIIDETVILRYLLDDDEVLSPRAAKVIATRTARVYPEIITRVVVTLRGRPVREGLPHGRLVL